MEKFTFPFCEEFSHTIEFKTSVVRRFDGTEQRQALWLNPKRTFSLSFESNGTDRAHLEDFFRARRGDFESFLWRWDEAQSGTGLDYKCFFDDPKMSQTIYPLSYAKTSLTLATLDDGNILKGRYFDRTDVWELSGGAAITDANASYTGASTLSQSNILTLGESYVLMAKIQGSQGLAPSVAEVTSSLPSSSRRLVEGENVFNFIACGRDLALVSDPDTSGTITEIALIKRPKPYPVFDFDYNVEHSAQTTFLTLKDDDLTYQNSRYSVRENPLCNWLLTLELSPSEAMRFDEFFVGQKGRYRTFSWDYEGAAKLVRFDTDKLEQKQFPLGYRQVKVPIIEVAQ